MTAHSQRWSERREAFRGARKIRAKKIAHWWPCPTSGKHGYPSRDQARRATAMLSNRTSVYFCKACGGWHVAHRDKR